jgi:phosphatidylserine decarboxylase
VVYVKSVNPGESVISIKQGVRAGIQDILREDVDAPKHLIGIFMSPFNVHYNRAPLGGMVESIRHHPAAGHNLHMGPMHLRTMFKKEPYYENSLHIVQNERTVTRIRGPFQGRELCAYIVQIGGMSVNGIDSYFHEGENVGKGQIFGMIRIGSQVDLVIPQCEGMRIKVQPGDRVRAGETIVIE